MSTHFSRRRDVATAGHSPLTVSWRRRRLSIFAALIGAVLSINPPSYLLVSAIDVKPLLVVAPTFSARGGASAAVEQPAKRKLDPGDLALAGAVATMIGDSSLHPIDCIKTLQQSDEGLGLGMLGASRRIYRDFGLSGFYQGLGTYVVSDGAAGALKFATYEALKKWVNKRVPENYVGASLYFCAALSFVAASTVLVPGELLKQRMQMGQISSIPQGIASIFQNEGIMGFFTGYSGVCLRDIPYTMLELGLYDNLKSLYLKIKNRNREDANHLPITQVDEIMAAAITGAITGYLTTPLDTIKTKLMVDTSLYNGFFDCLSKTVKEHGSMSVFQGGAARVVWLVPFTAIYLPLYELIKRRMERVPAKTLPSRHAKVSSRGGGSAKKIFDIKGGSQSQIQEQQLQPVCPRSIITPCRRRRRGLQRLDGTNCFVSF